VLPLPPFPACAVPCPSRYLNSRNFENLVINKIKQHIIIEKHLKKLVYLVNEQIDVALTDFHEELKIVTREEDGVAARLNKLYDTIETRKVNLDDLVPMIRDLRKRQEKLLAKKMKSNYHYRIRRQSWPI